MEPCFHRGSRPRIQVDFVERHRILEWANKSLSRGAEVVKILLNSHGCKEWVSIDFQTRV